MPPEHVAALEELDPWWRPPWTVMWQRFYYQARDHTRAHGALRPDRGFPTTSFGLGEWLYNQCTGYDDLHPAQQRLLADIGLTPEAVQKARPRRKHMATHFQRCLACARAFAEADGTLVNATTDTVQDGLKLGQWLSNQRSKDRAYQHRHGTPSSRALALSAIDPWWNPPWTLEWQRSWHQAHAHFQDGRVLDAAAGFPGTSSALAMWLTTQCAQYDTLLPDQQDLLTRIGITPDRARGAAARPAERKADVAVGLGYARSYHSAHGTLAAAISTVHDGFQLGRWLRRQRQHARVDAGRGAPPSAATKALTGIDPWWCPSWSLAWQRAWQHIHHQVKAGLLLDPLHEFRSFSSHDRSWLRRQTTRYDDLHPGQQRLLADIGLTKQSTRTRPLTPYAETALEHARSYTAAHGSLATPYCAVHDGFPLGSWLSRQRLLAHNANTPYAIHRALTTLDLWWNPPWPMRWQRAYHHARTTPISTGTSSWAYAQRAAWTRLHPQQRALLTDIGITPEDRTATRRREATRSYPPSPGLAHARAWAEETGNLCVPKGGHHDGSSWGMADRNNAAKPANDASPLARSAHPRTPSTPGGTHPGPTTGTAPITKPRPDPPHQPGPTRPAPPAMDPSSQRTATGPRLHPTSNSTSSPPSTSAPDRDRPHRRRHTSCSISVAFWTGNIANRETWGMRSSASHEASSSSAGGSVPVPVGFAGAPARSRGDRPGRCDQPELLRMTWHGTRRGGRWTCSRSNTMSAVGALAWGTWTMTCGGPSGRGWTPTTPAIREGPMADVGHHADGQRRTRRWPRCAQDPGPATR